MKRARTMETAKLRRTTKKRIGEGVMSSGVMIYMKLFFAWAFLMCMDHWIGFRFEYLWPAWLLLRSIYDSFRYQGFAFSMFFVTITITSDLVCFLFIPMQWLFFLASTYVWLQYVWHAVPDRGICLPTIGLCFLFVYMEAITRWREISFHSSRGILPLPFTLDLCRPFAAHCIGYPVVTLGFGVKSYVGYKYRLRKQREIAKENEVHARILTEAQPATYFPRSQKQKEQENQEKTAPEIMRNGEPMAVSSYDGNNHDTSDGITTGGKLTQFLPSASSVVGSAAWLSSLKSKVFGGADVNDGSSHGSERASDDEEELDTSRSTSGAKKTSKKDVTTRQPTSNRRREQNNNSTSQTHHNGHKASSEFYSAMDVDTPVVDNSPLSIERQLSQSTSHLAKTNEKIRLLELEVDRHKNEARVARLGENDARNQLSTAAAGERSATKEANTWKSKADQLDSKLQNERRGRDQERHTIQTLEKKLVEEQRLRTTADATLERERKAAKKADDARPMGEKKIVTECGEACKARRRDQEAETKLLRRDIRTRDEQLSAQERELMDLRHYKDGNNMEALMFSLQAFKDKNVHLEKSLRAENSLKQDLFSALGEAKHQIDTYKNELKRKNDELCRMRNGGLGGLNGSNSPVNGHNISPVLTPPPPANLAVGSGLYSTQHHNNLAPMNGNMGGVTENKGDGNRGDDVMLTNAIYSGVAAYLNTSSSSPITTGADDSFEDAAAELNTSSRPHLAYTPPRA